MASPACATEEIPIGCTFDATKGRVMLTDSFNGTPETVTLYDGRFKLKQKEGARPFLTAALKGRLGCPRRSSKAKASDVGELRAKRKKGGPGPVGRRQRSLHHQWRRGRGERAGDEVVAADRCDRETRFRVRKGKVVIDDFDIPGAPNRVLKAGKSYVTKD